MPELLHDAEDLDEAKNEVEAGFSELKDAEQGHKSKQKALGLKDSMKAFKAASDPDGINKTYEDSKKRSAASRQNLKDAEGSAADGQGSNGDGQQYYSPDGSTENGQNGNGYYTGKQGKSGKKQQAQKVRVNKRVLLLGTGGFGIAGLVLTLFLALVPLKVESMINNLQNHFFSSTYNALDGESESLLSGYFKNIIRSEAYCQGIHLNKTCAVNIAGGTPIRNLYKRWHQANVEGLLADKYGISLEYNSYAHKYYLHTPSTTTDVSSFMNDDGDLFQEVNRSDVRSAVDDALSNETKFTQVYLRFKFGRLMEEKYGIKRCITDLGCGITDKKTNTVIKAKQAAQQYVAERVLSPRSQVLGTVMLCLINPGPCDPSTAKSAPCTPDVDCELNEAPETVSDAQERTLLDSLVEKFGAGDAYKIYSDIASAGSLENYAIRQTAVQLASTFGTDATGVAAGNITDKVLPMIGWINLATEVYQDATKAGPRIVKLNWAINSAAMASMYMLYRTYADEVKTGNVDSTQVGSFTDSLGPGNHTPDGSANEVGGTASAEQSPLYQYLSTQSITAVDPSTASIADMLNGTAYAAAATGTTSPDDTCQNQQPVSGLICPEEALGGGNSALDSLSHTLDSGALSIVSGFVGFWQTTVGKFAEGLGQYIGSALNYIPGVSSLTQLVSNILQPVFTWASSKVINSPFGSSMSGARTYDMVAGGADVTGNDSAHTTLGGQLLTPTESAQILNDQNTYNQEQFNRMPLYAKIFSTDTPDSLVSKLAMAMPTSAASIGNSISGFLKDPFSLIGDSFGSVFSGNRVLAQATPQPDPFGVPQYGYPVNDPVLTEDPDTVWAQYNCNDPATTQNWNNQAAATLNPDNASPENTTTNPCLLIQAAVGSAGGYFDPSLLSPDDLADTPQTANAGTNVVAEAINSDQGSNILPLASSTGHFVAKVMAVLKPIGRAVAP